MNNREAEKKLTALREKEDREWPKKQRKPGGGGLGERDVLGQNMLIPNQHHTWLFLGISHCSILGQGPLSSCGPAERLQRPDAIRSGNKRSQSLVNVNDLPYI